MVETKRYRIRRPDKPVGTPIVVSIPSGTVVSAPHGWRQGTRHPELWTRRLTAFDPPEWTFELEEER